MQCPDCGYVLSAFDAQCPRCDNIKREAARRAKIEPEITDQPEKSADGSEEAPVGNDDFKVCPICGTKAVSRMPIRCKRCMHVFPKTASEPTAEHADPNSQLEAQAVKRLNKWVSNCFAGCLGLLAFVILFGTITEVMHKANVGKIATLRNARGHVALAATDADLMQVKYSATIGDIQKIAEMVVENRAFTVDSGTAVTVIRAAQEGYYVHIDEGPDRGRVGFADSEDVEF